MLFTELTLPSDIRRRNFRFTQNWESMKGSFHEDFVNLSRTHHQRLSCYQNLYWSLDILLPLIFPNYSLTITTYSYRRYDKRRYEKSLWFLGLESSSFKIQEILQIEWIWRFSLHRNASLPSDLRRTNFNFTINGERRKRSFHKGTTHRSLTAEELPSLESSKLSDTDPTLLEVSAVLLLIPPSPRH